MPILTDQERCGTLIGGVYRLESILGRGGMGVVFRARDEQSKRPVAVKILRPELAMQHPTFAKRFVREAKAAAAIKHPNVVEVFDVGAEPDGTAFQVLALLEGETLRQHLERKKALPLGVTLDILLPVMHALEAAHAASIVHRDLKPDNIFLARQPNGDVVPTLLDFGIAKLLEGHESFATNTGSILGTPSYMAPEQATGARVQGLGIDVWAMGIIVYECLSGAPPFTGTSPPHVMLKIMTENPAPLDELVPSVPKSVADVVAHALTRDLSERFPSMHAFREALRSAASSSDVAIPEVGRVSTATAMSIAPPPSYDSLDLSLALDSQERPRAFQDAPTVAATPSAVSVPSSTSAPIAAPPATRRPLVAIAIAGVLITLLAAAYAARAPEPVATPPRPEIHNDAVVAVPEQAVPVPVPHVVVPPVEVVEPRVETAVEVAETPPARPERRPRPRHIPGATESPLAGEPATQMAPERADPPPRNGLPGVVAW